jgi:hypothetical protein
MGQVESNLPVGGVAYDRKSVFKRECGPPRDANRGLAWLRPEPHAKEGEPWSSIAKFLSGSMWQRS